MDQKDDLDKDGKGILRGRQQKLRGLDLLWTLYLSRLDAQTTQGHQDKQTTTPS